MRDWDWLRPHTLNIYMYCSNDPINRWDPTGLYVFDECADPELQAAWMEQHQEALNSGDMDVVEAAASYGELGDDSVLVSFNEEDLSGTADAQQGSTYNFTINEDGSVTPSQLQSIVTFRQSKVLEGGPLLEADIAHEGSHQQDDKAFFQSWDQQKQSFDPMFTLTIEQTEKKAHLITHKVAFENGTPIQFSHGVLGRNTSTRRLNRTINNILTRGPGYKRIDVNGNTVSKLPEPKNKSVLDNLRYIQQ